MELITAGNKDFWRLWQELCDSCIYQHPMFSELGVLYYKEYFLETSNLRIIR